MFSFNKRLYNLIYILTNTTEVAINLTVRKSDNHKVIPFQNFSTKFIIFFIFLFVMLRAIYFDN